MPKTEKLKYSIQKLNSFIKEKSCQGSTFENQAIFNVLAKDFGKEVSNAKREGLSVGEIMSLLKVENEGMEKYKDFIEKMKNTFQASDKKIILN